tara:strand:- start:10014 stop:10241 length:228 start_codon:yes stop_codon:yes gene_type:complete
MTDQVVFHWRLPAGLRERLSGLAVDEGQTLTAWLIGHFSEALVDQQSVADRLSAQEEWLGRLQARLDHLEEMAGI